MMAIGCYFAFIIIVMGTISAVCDFTNEVKNQFAEDMLHSHNFFRIGHGVPKLDLSADLCKTVNRLLRKWTGDPDTIEIPAIYGSNTFTIYYDDDSELNPNMIFDEWYNYNTYYNYLQEPLNPNLTDIFTQAVWKSTQEIGVGISLKQGVLKVVVIYFPAGNQRGHYMSNVLDPEEVARRNEDLNLTKKIQFFEDIVDSHNKLRTNHNSPELILDRKLCVMADTYLKELMENPLITLPNSYGMNYAKTHFVDTTLSDPEMIVLSWYNNWGFYDYTKNRPLFPQQTNPFTQIVWKSTKTIGVGILVKLNMATIVVIYSPAGNQPGQFKSNVHQPQEYNP